MGCVAIKSESAQQPPTTEIHLYFVMGGLLTEAIQACAGPKSDLKGGWVVPGRTTVDTLSITKPLSNNTKAIDQSSYMSFGKTFGGHFPYLIWQASGQANSTQYAFITKENDRNSVTFKMLHVELTPTS
jgi:hypothetical protein